MAPITAQLALAVASLFSLSTAQTSGQTTAQCQAAGYTPQQCSLCPYHPDTTDQCASFDAGFDDLPDSGPVGIYQNANWMDFSVLTQTQPYNASTIGPYTQKHYAAVMPGKMGTIQFGASDGVNPLIKSPNTPKPLGQLRYFHYACARPDGLDPPTPIGCKITITASCLAPGATDPVAGPYKPFSAVLNYDPKNVNRNDPVTKTGMAYQALDFAAAYGSGQGIATPQECSNYTFSAEGTEYLTTTGPDGTVIIPGTYPGPVILLDDVLYNVFYKAPMTAPPPPVTCDNQGLEWAYYNNTAGFNPDKTYSIFDPTAYKKVQPVTSGVTSTAGGISQQDGNAVTSIYGSAANLVQSYFVLNHRGYIVAPMTGLYTFALKKVDDITEIWVGKTAYSGWTRTNENTETTYQDPSLPDVPGSSNFTIGLTAGQYYPLRIIFGQAQFVAEFDLSVSLPNGTVFLSSSSTGNPYLVRYSCDKTTAPPFAPFGSET